MTSEGRLLENKDLLHSPKDAKDRRMQIRKDVEASGKTQREVDMTRAQ